MTEHGIRPEQIAGGDCIAVIPGSKKGAAVVGVGYGRGFIMCRNSNSATLKPDESRNRALDGETSSNSEIVENGVETPVVAQPLIAALYPTKTRD